MAAPTRCERRVEMETGRLPASCLTFSHIFEGHPYQSRQEARCLEEAHNGWVCYLFAAPASQADTRKLWLKVRVPSWGKLPSLVSCAIALVLGFKYDPIGAVCPPFHLP